MEIVNQLLRSQGDARSILNLPKVGSVDWSDVRDLGRFEVVRAIRFDAFTVSNAEIGLNFVECGFNQCAFRNLITDGHLWGAGDRWIECVFERCELRGMIAPVNSFKGCRFEAVSIVNFRPHQTLFDSCSFSRGCIEGLKAKLISNSQIVNRELTGAGQLVFRDCCFEEMSFRQCYFEGVVFHRCVFDRTNATACSFEGVSSDVPWWGEQKSDPFTVFLGKALDLIRTKCGRDSAAYREFENYVIDFGSGKTSNKNFSESLYNDRVPYVETKKIIKDLRELVDTFPF
jgi:uncharacterized protein YjbI with pentapeptide repeats